MTRLGHRPRAASLAAGLALLAALAGCGSAASRLETANAQRHRGDTKGALAGYTALLADLGEGPLGERDAEIRWKALKYAGDLSYLELGDYQGALSYYRRIISLHPAGKEAREARAILGDIYRDRFSDPVAAIAQYADVAGSDAPEAPRYQLEVARQYLDLKRYAQARTEARLLRERWPNHELADEAQLLTGQAWSLEKRDDEALGALQALVERHPRAEVAARALEAEAHIYAQQGKFDRALELYALALPSHPNPDAIRTNIDAVRERRERSKTGTPGDRATAFDHAKVKPSPREAP